MLKEQSRLLTKIAVSIDVLIVFIAFFITVQLFALTKGLSFNNIRILWIPLISSIIYIYFNYRYKLYATLRTYSISTVLIRLVQSTGISSTIMFSFAMLMREMIPKNFYITFFVMVMVLMIVQKVIMKFVLYTFRKKGYNTRHIIIVGTMDKAQEIHQLINDHSEWGLKVIGYVNVVKDAPETINGCKVLGSIDELTEIAKNESVDEAVFCIPKNQLVNIEAKVNELLELGINIQIAMDFFKLMHTRFDVSLFHNKIPMLTITTKSNDAFQLMIKRIIDLFGAVLGLLLTGIIFPFVALAIKLEDGGPVFFAQKRVGMYNRVFKLYKFRSMYVDAERRKRKLMKKNEMKGAIFKIENDPRITKVGKFLRKTSLDEFPQFFNVLMGEMSLVGTRPPTKDEVKMYENWHRRRISVKPGITGMWQVSGRNEITDFDEIVRLDLEYIDEWSVWLDLRLLAKTIFVVLWRKGSR